jgi:OOP family OmpA-OmpF porin
MKILVPGLIVFAIWCLISVRWYVCGIYELCDEQIAKVPDREVPKAATEDSLEATSVVPLSFEWSNEQPTISDNFTQYRDSLKRIFDQSPASVVEITGLYDTQEINNSQYQDLGLARAENLKQLLLLSGIKRSMRVKSRTSDLSSGLGSSIVNAVEFELVPKEELTTGFLITERNNKLVIHYPTNAATPVSNQQVINALKKMADQALKSKRNLLVVGHTDSHGESMENMKLGLIRATTIKDMLLSYGMQENQVLAESEGEAVPLVSNTTPRGRQQNRRVEIILI